MKKIIYLHGLESNQGGQKVDFLSSLGLVYAPIMEYKTKAKTIFDSILAEGKLIQPDLIVGSSMGGYFAESLATHIDTKLLLFNPATINSESYLKEFEIKTFMGNLKPKGSVVLGMNDDVVNPIENEKRYCNLGFKIFKEEHGHRTDLDLFKKYIDIIL